jgi:hypothetical protein
MVSTEVCLFDESGEPVVLETCDLGPSGMFIRSELVYEPGDELWLSFHVPGGPKIVARGRVVRGQLGGRSTTAGMGVAFIDLTEREHGHIEKFVVQDPDAESRWIVPNEGDLFSTGQVTEAVIY